MISCAQTVLTPLFAQHPGVKVLNLFYDISCMEGQCIPSKRGASCGTNVTCNIEEAEFWQEHFSGRLAELYPGELTAINIQGAAQAAGGDKDARVGHPDLTKGSPCDLISNGCVHPGEAGWVAITDAMWDLYWGKAL